MEQAEGRIKRTPTVLNIINSINFRKIDRPLPAFLKKHGLLTPLQEALEVRASISSNEASGAESGDSGE